MNNLGTPGKTGRVGRYVNVVVIPGTAQREGLGGL